MDGVDHSDVRSELLSSWSDTPEHFVSHRRLVCGGRVLLRLFVSVLLLRWDTFERLVDDVNAAHFIGLFKYQNFVFDGNFMWGNGHLLRLFVPKAELFSRLIEWRMVNVQHTNLWVFTCVQWLFKPHKYFVCGC